MSAWGGRKEESHCPSRKKEKGPKAFDVEQRSVTFKCYLVQWEKDERNHRTPCKRKDPVGGKKI